MKKLIIEFLGTFFFFLFIGFVNFNQQASIVAPLIIGLGYAALIYAGAAISGGHYNPALSFAAWLGGGFQMPEFIRYICGQIAGVISAGLVISYFSITAESFDVAEVGPVLLAELLFTFLLAFVFLSTTKENVLNSSSTWSRGLVIVVAGYAIGNFSGAVLNPAVFIGNCINGSMHFSDIWIYFVAQFGGASLAALTFNFINSDQS